MSSQNCSTLEEAEPGAENQVTHSFQAQAGATWREAGTVPGGPWVYLLPAGATKGAGRGGADSCGGRWGPMAPPPPPPSPGRSGGVFPLLGLPGLEPLPSGCRGLVCNLGTLCVFPGGTEASLHPGTLSKQQQQQHLGSGAHPTADNSASSLQGSGSSAPASPQPRC